MEFLKSLIILLFIIMTIVVVHEAGHFVAAKIFGVYCHEFSIGMGPKIFSKKFKETTYSLRALPIGGFVKMAGEADSKVETKVDDTAIPNERLLCNIAKWKQIIVMFAGIFMNFVLAFIIMMLAYSTYKIEYPQIVDSPNQTFLVGDIIDKVDSEKYHFIEEVDFTKPTVEVSINRNGELITENINPNILKDLTFKKENLTFPQVIEASFGYCKNVSTMIFDSLKSLFMEDGYKNLGGPISMYNMVSNLNGFVEHCAIASMLSINVGIINALSLPVLDGGRVLLLTIEAIRRKKLSEKAENIIFTASFLALIGLMGFVIILDLLRLGGVL